MDDEARYDFDTKVRDITGGVAAKMLGPFRMMGPDMNLVIEEQPGRFSVTNVTLRDLVRTVLQVGEAWDRANPDRVTPRESIPS